MSTSPSPPLHRGAHSFNKQHCMQPVSQALMPGASFTAKGTTSQSPGPCGSHAKKGVLGSSEGAPHTSLVRWGQGGGDAGAEFGGSNRASLDESGQGGPPAAGRDA